VFVQSSRCLAQTPTWITLQSPRPLFLLVPTPPR
jgi:hypothetical protein